ncbi:MAG TPA: chemotaxis protein CheD [Gemmatimonadaceae bacterium]|nr:chemotaxis protein CheD [Gemmatimonadaceae bacterium]
MTERRVRVADYAVAKAGDTLVTIGLGSCVAIALYDPTARVGGLAHVLLPSEGLSRDSSNRAKFPTTAVPLLIEEMGRLGGRGPMRAKIVGGASMFGALIPAGTINMGERNVAASRSALAQAGIPLAAADVGGDYGRSVFFHLDDGRLVVRSLKRGERVI